MKTGRTRFALASAAYSAIACSGGTLLQAIPVFDPAKSSVHVDHLPGADSGASTSSAFLGIGGASPTNTFGSGSPKKNKINFATGADSSTSKAGVGHSESSNKALMVLPSGMGVDQIDTAGADSLPSKLIFDFDLYWDIKNDPFLPSNTAFLVNVGGVVGTGGSAKFEVDVHWDRTGPTYIPNLAQYAAAQTFSTPGPFLQTFYSGLAGIPSIPVNGEINFHGRLTFTADDPDDPTLIELVTLKQNPFAGIENSIDFGVFTVFDQESLVPEPGSASILGLGSLALLRRTRRR